MTAVMAAGDSGSLCELLVHVAAPRMSTLHLVLVTHRLPLLPLNLPPSAAGGEA